MNTLYIGFNDTDKPCDNVNVRQAIAMGIDRDRIVKNFYPGGLARSPTTSRRARSPSRCKGDD